MPGMATPAAYAQPMMNPYMQAAQMAPAMHQPGAYMPPYGMTPAAAPAPSMHQPGMPSISATVSPRDTDTQLFPYSFNVPVSIDAGYEKSPAPSGDDFFA